MSFTHQKYDPVLHPIVYLISDYNSIVDYLDYLASVITGYNPDMTVPTFILGTGSQGLGTQNFYTWVVVTINRIANCREYLINYKEATDSNWFAFTAPQSDSGDIVINSPYLAENTLYDFRVKAVNALGNNSEWAETQQITTASNNVALDPPSNVTAYAVPNGILLEWDDLGFLGEHYNIYRNTTGTPPTLPTTPTASITSNSFFWTIEDPETDYVTQYFWVTSVSRSDMESTLSTVASNTPQQIEIVDLDIPAGTPTFVAVAEELESTSAYRTWLKITITRLADVSGYAIQYKKSADTDWTEMAVGQSSTGDIVVKTPDLAENTQYDVRVCGTSTFGVKGAWATTQQLSTLSDATAPTTPTLVSATPSIGGVVIEWQKITALDLNFYEIFKNTTDNSATAVSVGMTKSTIFSWRLTNSATDYVTQYFWVKAVDNAENKSAFQVSSVSATPLKSTNTDVINIGADKILIDGAVYLSNWRHSGNVTKIDGGDIYTQSITAQSILVKTIGNKNLIGNPSFEEPFTNGQAWYGGSNIRSNEQAYYGAYSSKLVASGSSVGSGYSNAIDVRGLSKITVAVRTKITAMSAGDFMLRIIYFNASMDVIDFATMKSYSTTTDWDEHVQTFTVANFYANTAYVKFDFIWWNGSNNPNGTAYVDGWQCVAGEYLPVFDEGTVSADFIKAGTITANHILGNTLTISKMATDVTDQMFSDSTSKSTIEGWKHATATTKIDGGDIHTGTITADAITTTQAVITQSLQIGNTVITTDHLHSTFVLSADKIILFGSTSIASYDSTKGQTQINGAQIKTGSIESASILNISAEKILITGSVYFDDWFDDDGGTTRIHGANISTGTLVADRIQAKSLTVDQVNYFDDGVMEVRASGEVQFSHDDDATTGNTDWVLAKTITIVDGDIKTGCRLGFRLATNDIATGNNIAHAVITDDVGNWLTTEATTQNNTAPSVATNYDLFEYDVGPILEGEVLKLWIKWEQNSGATGTWTYVANFRVGFSKYSGHEASYG